MATYLELITAAGNDTLRQKVLVACLVAADKIRTASPAPANQAQRLKWAKFALENPEQARDQMVRAAVAQNRAAALAAIVGADDATVQTAVDNAIDLFADLLA